MSRILEILDENRLTSEERVKDFVFRHAISDVRSLREGLRASLRDQADRARERGAPRSLDAANFLASSSFRGDSGCFMWDCRVRKIRTVARYGALYCDTIVVPIGLDWADEKPLEYNERYAIAAAIFGILELRPLIEAGVAVLIPDFLQFCEKHLSEAVPLRPRIEETAQEFSRRESKRVSVTYLPPGPGGRPPMLNFHGPTDFIEHGEISCVADSIPPWLTRKMRTSTEPAGVRLSEAIVRKNRLLDRFFARMANDVALGEYWGIAYDARYITDLPGEAEFLRTLYADDDLARQTSALCARLTHAVPLLNEVPLKTVLKVRAEESEAFVNYRAALTQIVKDYVRSSKKVGDAEAKDIYADKLLPQILSLEAAAKSARRSAIRKATLKVAGSSALLALGIYGGILPAHLADFIKTIGGFKAAQDIAGAIGAIERNPGEIRNNNLYFLLRLKQEAR